eukprot:CAMPEP_0178916300 /NCGR_PEP_ID=MMETSP0786-20121207/12544_1 /TAXON_ID=186022 /ORGANISM="Thalassionema frauenfeldii, Strain CCMP 1798" /LENGTH=230 /DNA_ID=CAMNT_0020589583 /DNA_START=74 /DNA_END=766 /DNA_ORIENTATION=-
MKYEEMSIRELRQLLMQQGVDASSCLEKKDLIDTAYRLEATNFDDAARELFAQLNLQPTLRQRWNNLDAIWRHPTTGASVYVGNQVAASTKRTLDERDIAAVVNCQDEHSENYFEGELSYHRFVIQKLAVSRSVMSAIPNDNQQQKSVVLPAFQPTFDFIDANLEKGQSVLVHCLAGAHRAGTTGVAFLMYKVGLSMEDAIAAAKQCRPVINPFATLLREKELPQQQPAV